MKKIQSELSNGYATDVKLMSLTANQELALSRRSNLIVGNTYLFVPQAFHAKPDTRSATGVSNRAACYELDAAGNVIGIKTLSFSALRAAYLGKVTETSEIPVVEAEDRDGVNRAVRGTNFVSNIKGGQAPIAVKEIGGLKTAAITSPFALKVTGRAEFYTTSLERRDDGRYDMVTTDDGHLAIETRNDYEFDYVTPTAEMLTAINPEKDMPELKDYLL